MAVIYGIADSKRNILDKMPKGIETLENIPKVNREFEEKIDSNKSGFLWN
jgi:hypothetical protein